MKIYFATAISASRMEGTEESNTEFINHLKKYGEVLTEHFADPAIRDKGETVINDKEIHDRDMNWLLSAEVIVAEVTNTSLGVGYEIGRAVENKKKVLCLRRKQDRRLSAMIAGSEAITVKVYQTTEEGKKFIDEFFNKSY